MGAVGWMRGAAIALVAGLGGCVSTAGLSASSQSFVGAANDLAQAESDYFDEIQAASDAGHQLRAAADYVAHSGDFATIAKAFARRDDFSKAKQIRLAALKQLQNYAAAVAQIQSGGSASWAADDSKALTASFNDVAGDTRLSARDKQTAGAAQAIVLQLGQAVIDNASARKLEQLATAAKEPIAKLADMVAQDDANIEGDHFAEGLKSDQINDLINVLHILYEDPKVTSAERFAAAQTFVGWKPALVTKGQCIKAAMQKLQAANEALSRKQTADAGALVQQASALAQQALLLRPGKT